MSSRRIWVFDLDNTLHNATPHIFPHINSAMTQYLQAELGIDAAAAGELRRHYWHRYGATLLGLVTNELVTNAFKHCNGDNVVIKVKLVSDPVSYTLTVEDDGVGMPTDFVTGKGDGLGMRVVRLLTGQVGGKITMPFPGEAARFKILLPHTIVAEPPPE